MAKRLQRRLLRFADSADVYSSGKATAALSQAPALAHAGNTGAGGYNSFPAADAVSRRPCPHAGGRADHRVACRTRPFHSLRALSVHSLHRGIAADSNLVLGTEVDAPPLSLAYRRDHGRFRHTNLLRQELFVLFQVGSGFAHPPLSSRSGTHTRTGVSRYRTGNARSEELDRR